MLNYTLKVILIMFSQFFLDKTTVPICDIIAVQLVRPKCKAKPTEKSNRSQSGNAEKRETFEKSSDNTINSEDDDKTYETIEIEVDASDPIAFTLHYATRRYGGNRWRVQKRTFHSPDARIVRLWYDTIRQTLADDPGRPRHILLFINPYGGKQQATQIYDKHARPLFELAKVAVTVIVSQRANHIRDTIIKHGGLEQYDGIACIGGDGTFSEVFNGLVLRGILDLGLDPASIFEMSIDIPRPNIPIGIIPGGSTDTVAYCLHGTTDVRTACIHICLGQRTGLDLSSVSNANGLVRLYASVMSYGYLGDVAVDSEKFRWMGPKRYDYSGFKKFMANRCYEGEILIQQRDASVTDPADGFECFENCRRCTEARARKETGPTERSVIMMDEADAGQGNLGYVEDASGTAAVATCSPWKIVRGKFFMVNGANLSCACSRSPNGFSKFCHVGDGCVDLVVIRQTSFFNNLRLLMKLSGSKSQIVSRFDDLWVLKGGF